MTTATHPFRWRRVLAVGAASVLLHYAVIGWNAAPPPARPRTIVAQLHGAPPAPVPEAGAAAPRPLVQSSIARPLAKPAVPRLPRYRASLPPPAELVFDVARGGADGTQQSGQARMDWHHGGGQYRLTMVTALGDSVLLELASEGTTGAAGMVPRMMSVQRRGKARTATHFNAGRITFSASEASVPMAPGTQDRASLPMQLAGIARADPGQLGPGMEVLVGGEKDASACRFVVLGQEEIETGMGKLAAWRLSCPPAPGTYRARLEVWLAPGQQWYPVQLRSSEASGVVTTQTIRGIVVKDVGN
jgi:hypothetical protein